MNSKAVSILCIGDSHTAGFPLYDPSYGGNPESSYEYWLEKDLKNNFPKLYFKIDNQGICGEMTTDIFRRLTAIDSLERYNFILYWGGANDLGLDRPIEGIWNKQFPLKPFLSAENFKSYDELKAKLDKVLSGVRNTGTAEDVAIPPVTQTAAPVVEETVSSPTPSPATTADDDSDETLSYFSKLAEEDE